MKSLHRIKIYQSVVWVDMWNNLVTEKSFDDRYSCVVDTVATMKKDDMNYILDYLFRHFNFYELHKMKYPIKRSMSVGDIIELDGTKYQCMPTGWHKLDY